MMEKQITETAQKLTQNQNDILLRHAPHGVQLSALSCHIYPDGRQVYHYENKPFIEFFPMEFTDSSQGGNYRLSVIQRYRLLPSAPHSAGGE